MARSRRARSLSLADDERARVPFALVGVLLLVTSSAYAAGVVDQGLVSEDRSVERAVERVDADATAALRHAAREAAHDAAARPVTRATTIGGGADPAWRTAAGASTDAVRPGSAFEDAFRIRLALAGVEALDAVSAEVGDVSATVGLERIDDPLTPDDLETLRETVRVSGAANGTATRVVFEDVTVTATRGGRTAAEWTENRTVVVAVPTLAAHERTERFERRLNRGPVEGPGLGRQLTASLYPIAWARGYGQYARAPIRNVIANRHVELSTNAGIVRTQRDVFGTSDPDARGGVAAATARTGLTDLLAPTDLDESAWSDRVLDASTPAPEGEADGFGPARSHTDETTSVSVGHAADVAAVSIHDDLEAEIRGSYRVEASLDVSADRVVYGGRPRPPRPSSGAGRWQRVGMSVDETTRVVSDDEVPAGVPSGVVESGESVEFGSTSREVRVERVATGRWKRVVRRTVVVESAVVDENGTVLEPARYGTRDVVVDRETTWATATDRYRVSVDVTGRYEPRDRAPDRPTATFGSGRGVAGVDLAGTPDAARSDLGVDDVRDVDELARDAVDHGDIERSTVVFGERSDRAVDRIRSDLDALREEVHGIETDLSMEAMAVGEADPYGGLADELRDRRRDLVDAPETYEGAVDRARIAVRVAYLEAVVDELESASGDEEVATDAFLERVEDAFGGPSIGEIIASREAARDTEAYRVGEDGPGGAVELTPNASPGYLPRTAVNGATVEAVDGTTTRPLAVRNLNYVTVPYGDVAGGVVERVLGDGDSVRIGDAGRVLLATDRSLVGRDDPDLRADRDELAERVGSARATVDRELVDALGERTALTRAERRSVVESVAAGYGSEGSRAVAIADGEYADRVAAEAARVESLADGREGALAARLRVALLDATGRDAVRVPARFVDGPAQAVRGHVRSELEGAVEDELRRGGEAAVEQWASDSDRAVARWVREPNRSVGAGLPVAPVPGYWVATVNAWRVEARGEYPRFTLSGDVGTPGRPFEYVREESTVTVDVGGERVQLGRTEPVRFETETIVVVAVPAGPPGVGDVNGVRDETSPGW
ncbi:DUF7286 family protein [Halorubrum halodurans]|uniref:Uncharacterized protein n=1 Tax=Halorubrum halodurans TaxID=1383851 RepID=A0A256IQX1_9EURY|nr:hypothetical protein [Halorubrum halodurans]OYR58542.1 hypothetical protein DJ70_02815 [Halorubrum halodurans]